MDVKIEESWKELLKDEFEKPYFSELITFVKNEYAHNRIFPPGKLIFNAFNHCTVNNTKVVILGQDPYHAPVRLMAFVFQSRKESNNRHPYKIFLKKFTTTWEFLSLLPVTWNDGQTKEYFF